MGKIWFSVILMVLLFGATANHAIQIDIKTAEEPKSSDYALSHIRTVDVETLSSSPIVISELVDESSTIQNNQEIMSSSFATPVPETQIENGIGLDFYDSIISTDELDPPVFTSVPDNETIELGTNGKFIRWKISDANPDSYYILLNDTDTFVSSTSYTSNLNIQPDVIGFGRGTYKFTIIANDTFGNSVSDTKYAFVVDTNSPVLSSGPGNIMKNEGNTSQLVQWTVTDLDPANYSIYFEGMLQVDGDWTNGQLLNYTIPEDLVPGTYELQLLAHDGSGNLLSSVVTITVVDVTFPLFISTPSVTTINFGSTGNLLSWLVVDTNPGYYEIYLDSVLQNTDNWINNTLITYPVDGLSLGVYNYSILVADISGNIITNSLYLTVTDISAPDLTSISPPNNLSINEQDENYYPLTWTPTDYHPAFYNITRNGFPLIRNSTWNSGSPITLFIDILLPFGLYEYTLSASDDFGNIGTHSVFVTIFDDTIPNISLLGNISFSAGTTGNSIEWSATDTHPMSYILYLNEVEWKQGNWQGGSLSFSLDSLSLPENNLTIVFIDQSNNQAVDTIWVFLQDEPIVFTKPADRQISNETSGETANWVLTDSNPHYYNISRNGLFVTDGFWSNGVSIPVNLDESVVGIYIYTIWANDTVNNFVTHSFQVNVTDIPKFAGIYYESTINEGTTGNNITWTVTDLLDGSYVVYSNISGTTTVYTTGMWTSGNNVTIYIDGIFKGVYQFSIEVSDETGNSNTMNVIIEVLDNILPTVEDGFTPPTIEYDDGSGGNSITWRVIENNPDTYIVYLDNVEQESGSYLNNSLIEIDIDGKDIGMYTYILSLNDTSGNVFNTTVILTVNDVTIPELSAADDLSIVFNTPGITVEWIATDENPSFYVIYRNNTGSQADLELTNMTYISGVPISIDISTLSLPVGVYNFTIIVYDISGNIAFDRIIVEITDVPQITSIPSDLEFNELEPVKLLNWTAIDSKPESYFVYYGINGTLITNILTSGDWENDTTLNIDISTFGQGAYQFTIVFWDLSFNSINNTVIVVIYDTTTPTAISSPNANLVYAEGSAGNIISWVLNDTNSYQYTLRINDTITHSGSWMSETSININIDGFDLGYYTLNFTAMDQSGNPLIVYLDLTVIDNSRPTLNTPDDVEMSEGSSSNLIIWISVDSHPAYYQLYINDLLNITNQTWESGNQIIISLDSLVKGNYNYTIILFDTSGNNNTNQVMVTVSDNTLPNLLVYSLQPGLYVEGSSNNYIQIIASDLYPLNYSLFVNDEFHFGSTWETNIQQLVDIDGLPKGSYSITITMYDESLNYYTQSLLIEVVDLTPVNILTSPGNQEIFEETSSNKNLEWLVEDLYPNVYELYLNDTIYISGSWNNQSVISIDLTSLLLGQYLLEMIIYDASNNTVSQEIILTVIDLTKPQEIISPPPEITIVTGTTGNKVIWQFYDNHPESYVVELEGDPYAQGVWINNNSIEIGIDNLNFGIYNLTITVKDTSNNIFTAFVLVIVDDPAIIRTQSPDLHIRSNAGEGDMEYLSGNWLDVNGSMILAGEVEIKLTSSNVLRTNYSLDFTQAKWNIFLNYTGVTPGFYTWTIIFSSSGYQSQTIKVDVEVLHNNVEISFVFSDQNVVQGSRFVILVIVNYRNSAGSSISLAQNGANVTHRTGGVANVELNIVIRYIHTNSDPRTIERVVITDGSGRGLISLGAETTLNIKRLTGISATFIGSTFLSAVDFELNDLNILSQPPIPNQLELIILLLREFLGLILGIIILVTLILFLYWYFKRDRIKKINKILEGVSDAHNEITSMMEIKAIILQNHGGIPIYLEEAGQLGVDGVLISGFSKAISTFLDEIERSVVTGFETIQRDTFAINSYSSSLGRVIFLAEENLPDIMRSRMIELMTVAERSYENKLRGGISLSKNEFETLLKQTSLKYILLRKFTLNKRIIANSLKLKSLSRTIKENFRYLLNYQFQGEELSLKEIYNILRARLIPMTLVSQIISVGYLLNIYTPVITNSEDSQLEH